MNACTAIVGINWGDEGKGRMVDLMTEAYDVVIRYQGGANAGHTVINQFGEFEIHALPSGVFRKEVVNVIGNGVALDPEMLLKEIRTIQEKGVGINRSHIDAPHRIRSVMQDGFQFVRDHLGRILQWGDVIGGLQIVEPLSHPLTIGTRQEE